MSVSHRNSDYQSLEINFDYHAIVDIQKSSVGGYHSFCGDLSKCNLKQPYLNNQWS